jgi:hypothetical protein
LLFVVLMAAPRCAHQTHSPWALASGVAQAQSAPQGAAITCDDGFREII